MEKKEKITPLPKPEEFDDGLNFSRKLILKILLISIVVGALGLAGYLLYGEFKKPKVNGDDSMFDRPLPPDTKDYSNDYWGFRFQYPGTWSPVIGSFEDGEYYFANSPINFIKELELGQVLVEVRTFSNWKGLEFKDWLKDQQTNYLPQGQIEKQTMLEFKQYDAISYKIQLTRPEHNTSYWDVLAVSKNKNVKYLFILETADRDSHDRYEPYFEKIKNTIEFYTGFGQS